VADPSRLSPAVAALRAQVAARLPEGPLVVALSGGADSAVLAWAASQCSDQVRAVSVDHGMAASGLLMSAAADISQMLGVPHHVVVAEPSAESETALRENRYAALEDAVLDDEVILTGHTLDDQAETVLGNILRGTGVSGLGGIPAVRGRFCRPILDIARSEIREIAAVLELPFMDDPQNADPGIRRNQIRQEVIPLLADQFNPRLVEALGRLASSAVADDVALEERAARVQVIHRDGALVIPAAEPRARFFRYCRQWRGSPSRSVAASMPIVRDLGWSSSQQTWPCRHPPTSRSVRRSDSVAGPSQQTSARR